MENRKEIHLEDILDFIKTKWQLSIVEESNLRSVLLLFLAQKIK